MTVAEAELKTSWWSNADLSAFAIACVQFRCDPSDAWLVICSESQARPGSINWCPPNCPGAKPKSPYANAAGLFQLTKVAVISAGELTKESDFQPWALNYAKMGVAEQMPAVIKFFQSNGWFKAGHRYESALRLYVANAAPSMLFLPMKGDTVIYSGNAATINQARSSIGGLQAGLNYWKAEPLYEAGKVRLRNLFG